MSKKTSNSRNARKSKNFAGIPRWVVETDRYATLSPSAIKLLVLLAYQYKGKNNGDLVITHSLLNKHFKSNTTMYKARDELLNKGFIAINAYGGKSYEGKKSPHLYALTWDSVDDFINTDKNLDRYTHLPIDVAPLNLFLKDKNPYLKKTSKQKKKQFMQDSKRANVVHG